MTDELIDQVVKLRKEGLTVVEIGNSLSISISTVSRALKKGGVESVYLSWKENADKIVEMYNIGMSVESIADELGLSYGHTLNWISKYRKKDIGLIRRRSLRGKINVKLEDGNIVRRTPMFIYKNNSRVMVIRYKNETYLVGDKNDDTDIYKVGEKINNK